MQRYVDLVEQKQHSNLKTQIARDLIEMDYIYAYNGTIKDIKNFNKLKESGIICEIFQYKTIGDEVRHRTVSGDRVMGILLRADNAEELVKKRNKVLAETQILDLEDKDIMYRECFAYDL